MNWLVSETPATSVQQPVNPADGYWSEVKDTISYWALRMSPMLGTAAVFAACNRIGTEKGTTFTGSSCVLKLGERPIVVDYAGKTEERLLITEVDVP